MPNYILSRTSPPAHIYERKINLGYGIKVDTSDAPPNQTQKGKEMQDAKEVLDVADKQVDNVDAKPVATAAFADGTVFKPAPDLVEDGSHPAEKIAPPEGESNDGLAFGI